MGESMIPDGMAPLRNLKGDIRPLAYVSTDKEKRSGNTMLAENIQQIQRMGIIRAIVEGQGYLPRFGRQSTKRLAVPLTGGRNSLISGRGRSSSHPGDSGSKPQHAGIVNGKGRHFSKSGLASASGVPVSESPRPTLRHPYERHC